MIEDAIEAAVDEDAPMTVRQIYYRLVSDGVIAKTENEYKNTTCRLLATMRKNGRIAYADIADSTRWMRKPDTYSSLAQALVTTQACYRRMLWQNQCAYVEVWLEKEALAGVLVKITAKWDVPLMVTRGYSSLSFLHAAGEAIREQSEAGKDVFLYYFGDHDPSGVDISRNVKEKLREFSDADFTFERIAVTPEQIESMGLPTRPTKQTDSRAKKFEGESVEVDAIPPAILRELCEEAITKHIDNDRLDEMKEIEAAEKITLDTLLDSLDELGMEYE